MNAQERKRLSDKCVWMAFVMSIFVLYIHADNLKEFSLTNEVESLDYILFHLLGRILGRNAVPYFFIISGFWFYQFDVDSDSYWMTVKDKLKKRICTLVVPYLLWNTFGFLFYAIITRITFLGEVINTDTVPITFKSVINGIFFHGQYFTFWYLHDLIIVTFLMPLIIYKLHSKEVMLCMIAIAGVFYCSGIDLVILNKDSIFFYLLGAYISIYCQEKFVMKRNTRTAIICILLFVGLAIPRYFNIKYLSDIALMISPLLLWWGMDLIPEYHLSWFKHQSFFIYAAHAIPVTIVMKGLAKLGGVQYAAISYLATPWITLALLYVVAIFCSRKLPRFYALICGKR